MALARTQARRLFFAVTCVAALCSSACRKAKAERQRSDERRFEARVPSAQWAPPADKDAKDVAANLEQEFGVKVRYATGSIKEAQLAASQTDRRLANRALFAAAFELRRYPPEFLKSSKLRYVLVGERLSDDGTPLVGVALHQLGWFILDARAKDDLLRQVLHHELFHLFDEEHDKDPEWVAANPPGFQYDKSDAVKPDPSGSRIDLTRVGFISRYATFSPSEDKAELFAFLMIEPETVKKLARSDAAIAAKIAILERRVAQRGGNYIPWP